MLHRREGKAAEDDDIRWFIPPRCDVPLRYCLSPRL
ncbi:hypothetical protein LINPERPRIM_LOCUS11819 [Linum perenne]